YWEAGGREPLPGLQQSARRPADTPHGLWLLLPRETHAPHHPGRPGRRGGGPGHRVGGAGRVVLQERPGGWFSLLIARFGLPSLVTDDSLARSPVKLGFGRGCAMLLNFRVANHRSIRDELEWQLHPLYEGDRPTGTSWQAVPVAGIFGSNAAGKSNVVDAL